MEGNKRRVVAGLVVAAVILAAVPALVQLGWHARLFAGRATYPLDLEWMEGGVLVHAQRIAAGQGREGDRRSPDWRRPLVELKVSIRLAGGTAVQRRVTHR